ncbi:hypothetical protein [Chlamydiifrater volucris]|nr:hypothetical protein [Chlamydiifrater volucris]
MGILLPLAFSFTLLNPMARERSDQKKLRNEAVKLQEFLYTVERCSVYHGVDAEVWCSPNGNGGYLCRMYLQRSLPAKVWALLPKTLELPFVQEISFSGNRHAHAVVFEFDGVLGCRPSGTVLLRSNKCSQKLQLFSGGRHV